MDLDRVRIVLVRPRGPDNVGMAARAIANHGLGGLTLVAPACFDPDEARWRAPGAHDVVDTARIVGTVREAVADAGLVVGTTARRRRWGWPVWGPAELGAAVGGAAGPAAVLFGPEDAGLANEDLDLCHALLTLPTGERSSLNLAQAVTVTAHALRQHTRPVDGAAPPRAAAPAGMVADVRDSALALLQQAGYLEGRSAEQVQGTLYRLLARLDATPAELGMLNGMLAQVRWALEHPPAPPDGEGAPVRERSSR